MDIDGNLIRKWAKLFESAEGKDGKSFLEEDLSTNIDDILAWHAQKKAKDDAKAEEERKAKEAELEKTKLLKVTVAEMKPGNDDAVNIKYNAEFADGRKVDDMEFTVNPDDENFKKLRWKLRSMRKDGGDEKVDVPDEVVAVSMLQGMLRRMYPYKFDFVFPNGVYQDFLDRRLEGLERRDRHEDYMGWNKDDIDAMVDAGWRHPFVTG